MIIISDHALLRYIERVQGFDLDPLRKAIADIVTLPASAGASTTTVDGYTYCFVDRGPDVVVTTILFNSMRTQQYVKHTRRNGSGRCRIED